MANSRPFLLLPVKKKSFTLIYSYMKILKLHKMVAMLTACVVLAACKKSDSVNLKPVNDQFKATTDTITRNGFTLKFINNSADFAKWGPSVKDAYIETFFTVYPQIVAYFNPKAPHTATIKIDTAYDGIAFCDTKTATITFDPGYSLGNPGDWNVITHESTHIVQQYIDVDVPAWMIEGIADYSRVKFGVHDYAGWELGDYSPSQKYTDGYSTVARFLYWAEAKYRPGIAQEVDKEMRAGTYSNTTTWVNLTGSDFFQLWDLYTQDPSF
jgi:hypothetical protein